MDYQECMDARNSSYINCLNNDEDIAWLHGLGNMFYLLSRNETTFKNVEDVPPFFRQRFPGNVMESGNTQVKPWTFRSWSASAKIDEGPRCNIRLQVVFDQPLHDSRRHLTVLIATGTKTSPLKVKAPSIRRTPTRVGCNTDPRIVSRLFRSYIK
ncbi:unnamed protein product [Nezara viridula]|uniref:Uncharacterized protein n=1 Tax=Nezara viridula TaxID=85310 RepID=A0A9P0HH60_NEZVI|nr:unnamed protein product [Nezara viridula]